MLMEDCLRNMISWMSPAEGTGPSESFLSRLDSELDH